ncbi:MAG: 30S ribosomal protein S3 [Candidatus Levybacteria bacterium]|nr:30S ribosomal protein S3 [Candidatus Levybacteria bacterium]MBP9814862.1 30S ribosomal protein S3 [Candidatus Levybacteria bacterium]
MGQKVNPIALRLGGHQSFLSVGYYSKKMYPKITLQDIKIREMLYKKLKQAGVGRIVIERSVSTIKITIFVVRPGIVIGRGGSGLEDIKRMVLGMLFEPKKDKKNQPRVELKVEPVKDPNLVAFLVASNISDQLIRRMPFRRIMKQSIEKVMASGAKGVRIVLAGRINGAEIGRRERLQVGKVSLSTIREDIDYASVPALTKSGYIGVKVWIDRG